MFSRPYWLLILGTLSMLALIVLQVASLTEMTDQLQEDEDTRIRAALVRVRERIDPGDALTVRIQRVLSSDGFDAVELEGIESELADKLVEEYERQGLAPNREVRLWNENSIDGRVPGESGLVTHEVDLSRSLTSSGHRFGVVHARRAGLSRLADLPLLGSLTLGLMIVILVLGIAALRLSRGIEERSERQRAFVENLSHELRTPVFALTVAANTMAEDPQFSSRDRSSIERVSSAAKRVQAHVERLVQLVAVERGELATDSVIDLHAVLESIIPSYRDPVLAKGGTFDAALGAAPSTVRGDALGWTSVTENLLDNAIRYSNSVLSIAVTTEISGNELELRIEDRGPGVAPSQRKLIFERYHRVRTGTVHNTKGLGLGLTIAREVVEQSGGSIDCEPREGGGTRFRVRVPCIAALGDGRDE